MTRSEFEHLRDLPGKVIAADLVFSEKKPAKPVYILEPVAVENNLDVDLLIQGTFIPDIGRLTFNFYVRGVGPICRLCVNGRLHEDSGRTHKHDLRDESDPANNLPFRVKREDLDDKSPEDIWKILCRQANIDHHGSLVLPGTEVAR